MSTLLSNSSVPPLGVNAHERDYYTPVPLSVIQLTRKKCFPSSFPPPTFKLFIQPLLNIKEHFSLLTRTTSIFHFSALLLIKQLLLSLVDPFF